MIPLIGQTGQQMSIMPGVFAPTSGPNMLQQQNMTPLSQQQGLIGQSLNNYGQGQFQNQVNNDMNSLLKTGGSSSSGNGLSIASLLSALL